jgi:hypothetical protein
VVGPSTGAASCDGGEVMISAHCTGTFSAYPLRPTDNGASCGDGADVKVTLVCAKR